MYQKRSAWILSGVAALIKVLQPGLQRYRCRSHDRDSTGEAALE